MRREKGKPGGAEGKFAVLNVESWWWWCWVTGSGGGPVAELPHLAEGGRLVVGEGQPSDAPVEPAGRRPVVMGRTRPSRKGTGAGRKADAPGRRETCTAPSQPTQADAVANDHGGDVRTGAASRALSFEALRARAGARPRRVCGLSCPRCAHATGHAWSGV